MNDYDPTIYRGTAAYYVRGRPPYARTLADTLAAELRLDGGGSLLDVGCGPGVLTVELAGRFSQVVGVDPDAEMLAEAARRADEAGIANIRWVQARAEDIPTLDLGTFKLVTFGQSFHWTDRGLVAEAVYDILEPGGALALINHAHAGRPQPASPGYPTKRFTRSSISTSASAAAPARGSRDYLGSGSRKRLREPGSARYARYLSPVAPTSSGALTMC
jgi:ubiquinone/menaquinone biosynthesis C-methylase UbiE